jgi:hypothetical protein
MSNLTEQMANDDEDDYEESFDSFHGSPMKAPIPPMNTDLQENAIYEDNSEDDDEYDLDLDDEDGNGDNKQEQNNDDQQDDNDGGIYLSFYL